MPRALAAPGAVMTTAWRRLSPLPFGTRLFSWFVGRTAPYTGTVGCHCTALRPGFARGELRDRRRIRNHLNSIHAVALVNAGEMITGLAMVSALPPGVRGIPIRIAIEYHKKARGTLAIESTVSLPEITNPVEHPVTGTIRDAGGDVVATITVTWRLSPPEPRA